MPRNVIANLENGRRETITVPELLALAAALNVPPVMLLAPVGFEQTTEPLPGWTTTPWYARGWIVGSSVPAYPGADREQWREARLAITWYDLHNHLVNQHEATRQRALSELKVMEQTPSEERWRRSRFMDVISRDLSNTINALRRHRDRMRDHGLVLPDVPLGLLPDLDDNLQLRLSLFDWDPAEDTPPPVG